VLAPEESAIEVIGLSAQAAAQARQLLSTFSLKNDCFMGVRCRMDGQADRSNILAIRK
jgi:hypothetical protein